MDAALVVRTVHEVLRRRPDVALIFSRYGLFAVPAALAALRIPIVLLVPEPFLDSAKHEGASPIRLELLRTGFGIAARFASAIVTLDPDVPRHLEVELGIRGVRLLSGGSLNLDRLPWGPADEARRTIGLDPHQRLCALTGHLGPNVRVDLLALAHRKVAGLGLLVIGTGVQDPMVGAMAASTRPSSPVLHVPTVDVEARRIALQAADIALVLDQTELPEDARWAAALGRRIVALDAPGLASIEELYPTLSVVVRASSPTAEELRKAIETGLTEEQNRGPLPPEAVAAARERLGRSRPVDRLIEVLQECASSS